MSEQQSTTDARTIGTRNAFCSFCRKNFQEVGPLAEGPNQVFICGDCAQLCIDIIEQERKRRGIDPKE